MTAILWDDVILRYISKFLTKQFFHASNINGAEIIISRLLVTSPRPASKMQGIDIYFTKLSINFSFRKGSKNSSSTFKL